MLMLRAYDEQRWLSMDRRSLL